MMARLLDIPRSLAFYAAFYGGSVPIVLSAVVLLLLGSQRRFRITVHAWSGWHRVCARWLLGQRLRIEGALPEGPVMVAVKHESFFEAIDLPTLLPLPVVFAKAELLRIPLWGLAGGRYGLVAVERLDELHGGVSESKVRGLIRAYVNGLGSDWSGVQREARDRE